MAPSTMFMRLVDMSMSTTAPELSMMWTIRGWEWRMGTVLSKITKEGEGGKIRHTSHSGK